ncbi:WxcM-like protein [Candidatus Magnetobacterium bavaricum]|uniref:dTDP-4-dehydrorhamnose 3,5-epimerase n=1 Tax=Candidatus Magnetobacterium bavaricum TaxID=29290 RepID=A0A0F3GKX2_9BACT|nr:WxcM-like protein [Candidatus Magnetobacterium bavaricum]
MVSGVIIEPLRQIRDDRGKVMHMLRCDSPFYHSFGEIYFSMINPGAIKAWKLHKQMTMNLAVPYGEIKLVLFDDRKDSPTRGNIQEIITGANNYCLIIIPPMIWNGFQAISNEASILANCATVPHDPNEIERLDYLTLDIPYKW